MTKRFFYLASLLCALTLSFTSCEKDDDDDKSLDSSDLYGCWQAVSGEYQEYINGELVDEDYYEEDYYYGFRLTKDGDWYYWEEGSYDDIDVEYGGTYSYKNGKLTMEEDGYVFTAEVMTLTSNKMVLKITESFTEGRDKCKLVHTTTYRKVDIEL